MRLELKNLMGATDGPTFAQTYGFSFHQSAEWAEQGLELARQGLLDEARVILEGLVTLNPRSAGFWYALGCVYQLQELADDAVQAFSMAVSREPKNTDAWLRLGILKLKGNDRTGGLEALKTVVQDTRAESVDLVARARAVLATAKI